MSREVPSDRVPLERVSLEITPRPTESERQAIVEALEGAIAGEYLVGLGAWWAAGLPTDADGGEAES